MMKRFAVLLVTTSCFGMLPDPDYVTININNNNVSQDEYFCNVAMQVYHKKTSLRCSPELKPYLLRTLDYSRHNGDSERFASMPKDLSKEDEDFFMKQVNQAVSSALKDQRKQIDERIPKRDAALWVAGAGLACTILTTAITLGTTLSGKCP